MAPTENETQTPLWGVTHEACLDFLGHVLTDQSTLANRAYTSTGEVSSGTFLLRMDACRWLVAQKGRRYAFVVLGELFLSSDVNVDVTSTSSR